jgi:hypothetical protein
MANPYRGPPTKNDRVTMRTEKMLGGNGAPYETVRRAQSRCKAIDVHELMKTEIYAQNNPNDGDYVLQSASSFRAVDEESSGPPTVAEVSAVVGFEDRALYLDSIGKAAANTSLDTGTIAFNLTEINNNVELRNVISMRIDPFYFPRRTNPRPSAVPTAYIPNAPDLFFYRKMYVQVLNLPSTQSVNGRGTAQFTWEVQVDDLNSLAVKCTPTRDTFYLPQPLISLSELQLRFLVPSPTGMRPITLFNDVNTVQFIPGTNPARFFINSNNGEAILNTYIPPIPPGGVPPPIVAPGVPIIMTGFNWNQAITPGNTLVNTMVNNEGGLFITSIQYELLGLPFFSPAQQVCTFTIADIDGSPIPVPASTTIDLLNPVNLPQAIIPVASTALFPLSGTLYITTPTGIQLVTYTGVAGNTFTGCTGGTGTLLNGRIVVSGATNVYPNTNQMIIMQHRIALPIYFTSVRDRITNHIAITHE